MSFVGSSFAGIAQASRWSFGRVSKTQPRLSLDDLLVPVRLTVPEGGNPDPSFDTLNFQFIIGGLPLRQNIDPDGWLPGEWLNTESGLLYATISVGPGGDVDLAEGKWAVAIQVIDDPTAPVATVGIITIT